jgi:hypothetical protein
MRQRGRKSAENVVALRVDGEPPRLDPPSTLDDRERTLFVQIVEACAPTHFAKSDVHLLIAYVQSILLSQQAIKWAAKDPSAALATWEKSTRMQATLATRLRLAPQSWLDAKTLARQQPPP